MFIALLCFVAGMCGTAALSPWFLALAIPGFLAFFSFNLLMMFGVRCPSCGENLGFAMMWPPQLTFKVPRKVRFCQFCGVNFDKEIGN